jgi:Tol biopolymer transport system component
LVNLRELAVNTSLTEYSERLDTRVSVVLRVQLVGLAAVAAIAAAATLASSSPLQAQAATHAVATGIVSIRIDGSNRRLLLPNGSALSRGPNGRIAFLRGHRLATMNVDGTALRSLVPVEPDPLGATPPTWSPDGRRIGFGEGVGCNDTVCRRWEVWIGDAQRATKRRFLVGGAAPSWSPDGTRIAYEAGFSNAGPKPKGSDQILVAKVHGDGSRQIAHGGLPRWSPRGELIAYLATSDGYDYAGLHVVEATGRGGPPGADNTRPICGGPDGRRLAFMGPTPFDDTLFVATADGRNKHRIGPAHTSIAGVAWSPDGSKLVWTFYDSRRNSEQLMLARSDGSGPPRQLTHERTGTFIATPIFSADGRRILYAVSRAG